MQGSSPHHLLDSIVVLKEHPSSNALHLMDFVFIDLQSTSEAIGTNALNLTCFHLQCFAVTI